jgi:hypothetical protein
MADMSDPANYQAVQAEWTRRHAAAGIADDAAAGADQARADTLETVRVEVQPDPSRAGTIGPADLLERFSARVDDLGRAVGDIAERLRSTLDARLEAPEASRWRMSEVMMEFGLNLEAETGIVVVKGKTAAAFKVAITWRERSTDPPT